jgi:hypothetical protein
MAALMGFNPKQQDLILDRAQELLRTLPPPAAKLWATNIRYDRLRVQEGVGQETF